ncbi:MAG: mannose-1-phosphate guanylyltransferase/mannose-6-phosphate isomerase [Candidatus Nitricoxidivorans perseverans]|uniref:mannose-1-phosphate guanylyltransferase n=1 Tax=Candidatus Nitricoxidivorans perseverans TaxID=2975601 RepID=A0AA49FJA9_9PROT|nr:MAG: mannose-1-phosphate guanylyltransferase/mannose-6-phosphate isomerase [Candidatus Nitricoxidivorans perseverans]
MRAFIPVILSGGAGTRLWPVSREALPKPFIKLPDGESLLAKTLLRAAALPDVTEVLTVTNRDHYFLTRDEYELCDPPLGLPPLDYLLEPFGRNTAPAIAAAALHVAARHGPDAALLVLPADHLIADHAAFAAAVAQARELAAEGWLATFGIRPTGPESGFGYIEAGEALDRGHRVVRFIEKPTREKAAEYLAAGNFTWNSGMFCFTAGALADALREHAPDLLAAVEATLAATDFDKPPPVLAAERFRQAPDISIDYAVMERAGRVAVVPAAFDWSDIGSWNALAELTAADGCGNRVSGEAVLVDAANCFVQGCERVVAAVGVKDLLIVDTADALLVADRSRAQDVKAVVQQLRLTAHDSVRHHRTVHRPWGTYTVLEEGDRFKIKRIAVKPGASLSLQMHHHRSEHWVVVSGMARVVNGEREIFVRTDESTYIPAGTAHRLSNPGVIDCVMIEVQTGDYLGEDDIVRFEDKYGRSPDTSGRCGAPGG